MRETQVRSLGWEDPLEKEMATHSSILAWKISWMEKPGWVLSMGSQRVGHDWATSLPFLAAIPEVLHLSFFIPYPLNVWYLLYLIICWFLLPLVPFTLCRRQGRINNNIHLALGWVSRVNNANIFSLLPSSASWLLTANFLMQSTHSLLKLTFLKSFILLHVSKPLELEIPFSFLNYLLFQKYIKISRIVKWTSSPHHPVSIIISLWSVVSSISPPATRIT